MVSIFGIAKKGFGKAVRKYKQKKIASGKATREERIKYGQRDPDFKVKKTSKSLKASKEAGHGHMYMKNIKELNIHKDAVLKGEAAKKKIKHMKDTKRAYSIGDYSAPADPAKPPKQGYDK